jgi:adenosylcobinamide-GDP ribazoletransferase
MTRQLRAAAAAVTFLTRVPLAKWVALDADDVRRAAPYFPLVGAAVGVGSGALAGRLTPPLGAALGFAGATIATGALHLDALADTADATGADTPEHALEIMRDSRVGAFGVAAITCDALIKTAALAALAERRRCTRAGLAAGALSRAVPVALAAALPYARTGGGTGEAITGSGRPAAATAGLAAVALTVAATGTDGLWLSCAALGLTVVLGAGCRRWLGGVTGDTLGAATELTETAALTLAVALDARR